MAKIQTSWWAIIGGILLRIALLTAVLAQLGYLANEYAFRVDLTSDKKYTLTPATARVLEKLEEGLIIEAYFSDEGRLPANVRPFRRQLVSLLEEYEALGGGKVQLQLFDPFTDTSLREKVERLGLKPQAAAVGGKGAVTTSEVWQGLRLRYGANKQRVIPFIQLATTTAAYERMLTPSIKELTIEEKTKIGVLAFRSRPGGGGLVINQGPRARPQGFGRLLNLFGDFYEMTEIDLQQGALVPEDIEHVILIRPKVLSDRTKFVLDQFLMRGGKLVVFADNSAELEITPDKYIKANTVGFDAPGSQTRFGQQLLHYGIEVQDRIVGDGVRHAHQIFHTVQLNPNTQKPVFYPIFNPFCLEPINLDWSEKAADFSPGPNGEVDEVQAAQYRKLFKPGVNPDHKLTEVLTRGGSQMFVPGMFWPCPVDLATVPDGAEGTVLLRTSPLGFTEASNVQLDPFNGAQQGQIRGQNLQRWEQARGLSVPRTNPSQIPLAAIVSGKFTSFFADKEIPLRPQEKVAAKKKDTKDPLADDWGEEGGEKKEEQPAPIVEKPEPSNETKLSASTKPGLVLVIGDSDMLRDDFIMGAYAQPPQSAMNTPLPLFGPCDKGINIQAQRPQDRGGSRAVGFFKSILDWLAEDRDLLELEARNVVDRTLKFAELDAAAGETQEEFVERLESTQGSIRLWMVTLPILSLLGFGFLLFAKRSVEKRRFLSSLG